jgi:single-stranded DNA-binding protein
MHLVWQATPHNGRPTNHRIFGVLTTVRVATNDREQPEFHDVLWRQHADFATKYMTKGRLAYIEGRQQSRTWEAADGSKRRTVEVVADTFKALSSKPADRPAA